MGVSLACVHGQISVDETGRVHNLAVVLQFLPDSLRRAVGIGVGTATGLLATSLRGLAWGATLGLSLGLAAHYGLSLWVDYTLRVDYGQLAGLDAQGQLLLTAHAVGFDYHHNKDYIDDVLVDEGYTKVADRYDPVFEKGHGADTQRVEYDISVPTIRVRTPT